MSNFIFQAILDIHYESSYPTVALLGDLYKIGYVDIKETPFRNVPKEIRDNNPDFKHQAMYELSSKDDHYKVNIGDNMFGASTENYVSWNDFVLKTEKIFDILFSKHESQLKITRIGLRYFDMIENHNIFDDEHIKIEISNDSRNDAKTINIRLEDMIDGCKIVESIIYPFKKQNSEEVTGTFIDIVTAKEGLLLEGSNIKTNFDSISNELHTINKNNFRKILSDELCRQIRI